MTSSLWTGPIETAWTASDLTESTLSMHDTKQPDEILFIYFISTNLRSPGCDFLAASMALLVSNGAGQCSRSIVFIILGRWVTEFPFLAYISISYLTLRISVRLNKTPMLRIFIRKQLKLVRIPSDACISFKPLRIDGGVARVKGTFGVCSISICYLISYHWQAFQSDISYVPDPMALHHILVKVSTKFSIYIT